LARGTADHHVQYERPAGHLAVAARTAAATEKLPAGPALLLMVALSVLLWAGILGILYIIFR
jgi:hypothetical protein